MIRLSCLKGVRRWLVWRKCVCQNWALRFCKKTAWGHTSCG